MKRVIKNQPPSSFLEYINSKNKEDSNYKPTYEGIDDKQGLKKALYDEQGGICGYCQIKISLEKMKVEHHCEQSICNGKDGSIDKSLDYTNLLAVCLGKFGTNETSCDTKKSEFNSNNGLPIEVSPWNISHMDAIKYTSNGNIISNIHRHNIELNEILNLNSRHLKDLRSKKFNTIFKESRHLSASISKLKMKKILEKDLDYCVKPYSNSFPGLSEYMLKKFCR